MDIDNLVRMANRIGDFFEAMPDQTEARAGVANHLQKFWAPQMRRELMAFAEGEAVPHRAAYGVTSEEPAEPVELKPIVRAALAAHRDSLLPR